MTLVVKLVEWTAVVGLIGFALFAESWREGVAQRAAEREEQVRDAQRVLAREKAQDALDAAYRAAEEQAHAAAEVGLGWSMPRREQVVAAASDGGHDRLVMSDAVRALEVALLEGEFFHESRPPIAADPETDDAKYW